MTEYQRRMVDYVRLIARVIRRKRKDESGRRLQVLEQQADAVAMA